MADPCNLNHETETQKEFVSSNMFNLDLPVRSQKISREEFIAGSPPSFWDQLPTTYLLHIRVFQTLMQNFRSILNFSFLSNMLKGFSTKQVE